MRSQVYLFLFAAAVVNSVQSDIRNENFDRNEILPIEPRDYNCYDIHGIPHINDIPHPNDCNRFLKCQETIQGPPAPVEFYCASNLHFSLTTCRCEHPHDAECFENGNIDHEMIRMKCACPLTVGPDGSLIPDSADVRCKYGKAD